MQTGLPVIDGDGMGRAFPELQMKTFSIYGVKATPAALCDVRHNTAIFPDLPDTQHAGALRPRGDDADGRAMPGMHSYR